MENLARLVSETLARNGFELDVPLAANAIAETTASSLRASGTTSVQNRQASPATMDPPVFPAGF